MKRRNFIKALGVTTAVATLGSKKVQADAKKYKWKMGKGTSLSLKRSI